MQGTLRSTLRLLRGNWHPILVFELVCRLVFIALVGPAYKLALDSAMAAEGFAYLTHETVGDFVTRPPVFIAIVFSLFLFVLFEFVNIAALHYLLDLSRQGIRARALDAFRFGIKQAVRTLRLRSLAMLPLTLLLVPLLGIGVLLGVVFSLETPELFLEHLSRYTTYLYIAAAVVVVGVVVLLRLMFSFVYTFFGDESFVGAIRKSWRASKGHAFSNIAWLIGTQIAVWIVLFCALALILVPLMLALPSNIAGQNISFGTKLATLVIVPAAVVSGLVSNAPTSCAVMIARLWLVGDQATDKPQATPMSQGAHAALAGAATIALAVACLAWGIYHVWETNLGPMSEFEHDGHTVTVTAHRGGGATAPENTLAAFAQAAKDNADVCELDVQMSKDGKIFVSHDSDFNRISGVDKGAWELTYDEVRELDATGKQWEGKFERQHYPLLDEVLDWANEAGMTMNIELKPTGHEVDFEQAVVDIIHAHDFVSRCIVTSQVYDCIYAVHNADPNLTCVYVARYLYGDVSQMPGIDVFSVEENSVRPALVENAHETEKTVLAWTVDAPRGMERAVLNGADSVITDDVLMAQETIAAMRHP